MEIYTANFQVDLYLSNIFEFFIRSTVDLGLDLYN